MTKFRFKVGKYWLYVLIFPTLKQLRSHYLYHKHRERAVAAFAPGSGPTKLGEIALVLRRLNLYSIAHEATHAGLEYQRRFKGTAKRQDEETLCYAIGGICEAIHVQLRKLGLEIKLEAVCKNHCRKVG